MDRMSLKLFIAGHTARSERAVASLRLLREAAGQDFDVVIVDVLEDPELAESHRVIAVPTLIKEAPPPGCRFIGDLSNQAILFKGLGLTKKEGSQP